VRAALTAIPYSGQTSHGRRANIIGISEAAGRTTAKRFISIYAAWSDGGRACRPPQLCAKKVKEIIEYREGESGNGGTTHLRRQRQQEPYRDGGNLRKGGGGLDMVTYSPTTGEARNGGRSVVVGAGGGRDTDSSTPFLGDADGAGRALQGLR